MKYFHTKNETWIDKTEFMNELQTNKGYRQYCLFDDIQEVGSIWCQKILKNVFDSHQIFVIKDDEWDKMSVYGQNSEYLSIYDPNHQPIINYFS